jgi:hypothetical protein
MSPGWLSVHPVPESDNFRQKLQLAQFGSKLRPASKIEVGHSNILIPHANLLTGATTIAHLNFDLINNHNDRVIIGLSFVIAHGWL